MRIFCPPRKWRPRRTQAQERQHRAQLIETVRQNGYTADYLATKSTSHLEAMRQRMGNPDGGPLLGGAPESRQRAVLIRALGKRGFTPEFLDNQKMRTLKALYARPEPAGGIRPLGGVASLARNAGDWRTI